MKYIFIIMLFFSNLYFLSAQDCTASLRGTITDYHNKSSLSNASVLVIGKALTVYSDANGNYTLSGLCEGKYELEVSHPSCATQIIPITIEGKTRLDITLEHHLEELKEVKVVGDAVYDKTNSAQEVNLSTDRIENFSTATLGDALKELGGVSTLNTGATIVKPAIHGLNGSRVLILNDGVRMQDMEWGDEHAPNIDINSAGSIKVIKGASALQYGGDAIGGVVVINPSRAIRKDTLYGRTILGGHTNGRGYNISSSLNKNYKSGCCCCLKSTKHHIDLPNI